MFINKRKKIINSVFGELKYRNLMYHGKTQITLWDKTNVRKGLMMCTFLLNFVKNY